MKKLKPNVRAGGKAKPIGNNLYYMSGRKHSQGGIDIGDTLEVEGGEIIQTTPKEVKVFSAQPILNGNSPAKLVMGGVNPNKVFKAQEQFKDMNGLNDDGTTKFACGGRKKKVNGGIVTINGNVINRAIADIDFPSSTGGRKKAALGTKDRDKDYIYWNGKLHRVTIDEFGDIAYEPVDDRTPNTALLDGRGAEVRRAERQVRDAVKRDAAKRDAKQEIANSPLFEGIANFDIEPFKPIGLPKNIQPSNKKSNSAKRDANQDVRDAAKRDAKGVRTDFRSMLEIPQFRLEVPRVDNTSNTSKPKTSNKAAVSTTNTTVPTNTTKASVPTPRKGNGTVTRQTKPNSTRSTNTTKPKTVPTFDSLDSIRPGLPADFYRAKYSGAEREAPEVINPNTTRSSTNVPDVITSPKKRLALFDTLDTNDIIGLGANTVGSIASGINTRKALNNMEGPAKPVYQTASKLKTNYNINPQLGDIEENTTRTINDISANTSSSRNRLQRIQRTRNAAQYSKNTLRGQKENVETQLINADRMNRQQVRGQNVAAYNDYRNRKNQFDNSIREQKTSSINNMFSGINSGIQDMLSRIENRRSYNNTLGIYAATHPNVDKRLFTTKGVKF